MTNQQVKAVLSFPLSKKGIYVQHDKKPKGIKVGVKGQDTEEEY